MTKVYLSPSSQTENLYAWGGTNEAAQCRAIAAACEAALKRSGFDVRTGAGTMYTRVPESNAWGASLHVAIHTNAANGKTTGTRCYAYRDGGDGFRAARAIFDKLAPITPGASEGVFTTCRTLPDGSWSIRFKSARRLRRGYAPISARRMFRPKKKRRMSRSCIACSAALFRKKRMRKN